MGLFDKCYNFTLAKAAKVGGYYPYFLPLDDTEGTEVVIEGKKVIMIGSNNYLGLTTHPKVRQAAVDAVNRYGTSCTGSRFLNGSLALHEELEERLAAFVGKEAALVFSTGYQTNLGTISALVGKEDVAVIDKEDHASIIDGCQLSLGKMKRFRHNDPENLAQILERSQDAKGILVIVDGVFSMGGDIAPLPELVQVCQRYGARLMVDDAHSFGVLGGGRGTEVHFGLDNQVDLVMGTFSKSFASLGGFIAGAEPVVHYVQHFARSLIFSASMPASNVAAALAALEIMETEPEWVERLWENARFVREGYLSMGFNIGPSETPVIPIILGDDMLTMTMWRELLNNGVYTNPVISPGVPPGTQRLRTSYMATHTKEQLQRVLDTFEKVGKDLGIIL